ncbi:MAG: diaminopimelate epimerase [Bdellovibrionales bacterium]|nr:diaminopimelate epimerase [Massilia sp.]
MKLTFTKMHGAGNDFVVIDAVSQSVSLTPAQCQFLGERRVGVGADQILVVEKAAHADCDFRYRIFNQDGSEVEQCGNGARAFVKFVTEKGLTSKRAIRVETMKGIITPRLEADGSITVEMGGPVFEPALVPFADAGLASRPEGADTLYQLDLRAQGARVEALVSVLSMGNPHAVQVVDNVDLAPVAETGPQIERHPHFPQKVNAGFMQVVNRSHIRLRVFERGAGETLACGTGACAAVVAGIRRGLLDSPVRVSARGGELSVAWEGGAAPVFLSGPAMTVYEGTIELPELPAAQA